MDEHRATQDLPPDTDLAGLALRNGVLVLGPNCWAVAVRDEDGEVITGSGNRPSFGEQLVGKAPLLRGPLRLANMFATLPVLRRAVPQVRFGFESRPLVLGVAVSAVASRVVRKRLGGGALGELGAGAVSLVGMLATMRGGEVAEWHGAEHKTIAGYEQGVPSSQTAREHPRCGTQLAIPLLACSAVATHAALLLAPGRPKAARAWGQLVGIGAATELFRAAHNGNAGTIGDLTLAAGLRLQSIATTAEPDAAKLDVAGRALDALLEAERARA